MNTSSDAAEQLVRMSLNSAEVAVKVSGAGAKQIAILLYAIMKDQNKTKGKTRLNNMLKSGQALKIYSISDTDLKLFCQEAKKYGVLYCVLKDKNSDDGMTDIMVREFDAARINRIFERFNLANVDMASVRADVTPQQTKDKDEIFLDKVLGTEKENFHKARSLSLNQSEPSLNNSQKTRSTTLEKPSIKWELNKIKEQMKSKPKTKSKQKQKSKKRGKNR